MIDDFYEPEVPWYADGDSAGQEARIYTQKHGMPKHLSVEELQKELGVTPSPLDETEWRIFTDGVNAAMDVLMERRWQDAILDDIVTDFVATYGTYPPPPNAKPLDDLPF